MLLFPSTTDGTNSFVAHCMLEEDFLDAAVYTTTQGNQSASNEDSGDKREASLVL